MTLDESTDEDDVVTALGDVKVAYDRKFDAYLNDVTIDYEDTPYSRGFHMTGSWIGSC